MYSRLGQIVTKIENWKKNNLWWSYFTHKFVKETFYTFFAQMALELAWICEYLQASCSPNFFKWCSLKFAKEVVFHKYFKFCFYKATKNLIFNVPLVVQISIFTNCCKSWKRENLKNDGQFWISHHISL